MLLAVYRICLRDNHVHTFYPPRRLRAVCLVLDDNCSHERLSSPWGLWGRGLCWQVLNPIVISNSEWPYSVVALDQNIFARAESLGNLVGYWQWYFS